MLSWLDVDRQLATDKSAGGAASWSVPAVARSQCGLPTASPCALSPRLGAASQSSASCGIQIYSSSAPPSLQTARTAAALVSVTSGCRNAVCLLGRGCNTDVITLPC